MATLQSLCTFELLLHPVQGMRHIKKACLDSGLYAFDLVQIWKGKAAKADFET